MNTTTPVKKKRKYKLVNTNFLEEDSWLIDLFKKKVRAQRRSMSHVMRQMIYDWVRKN